MKQGWVRSVAAVLGVLVLAMCAGWAQARSEGYAKDLNRLAKAIADRGVGESIEVPAKGKLELAFSPGVGGEDLVMRAIRSAKREVRIMAYGFSSARITAAVLEVAKRRIAGGGRIDIKVIADEKANTSDDRSGKSQAALSALVAAGCEVRLTSAFSIHHDKVVIVDGETVELGSFNFTESAAKRNSENVLVHWGNPELAAAMLAHFDRNFRLGKAFVPRYEQER